MDRTDIRVAIPVEYCATNGDGHALSSSLGKDLAFGILQTERNHLGYGLTLKILSPTVVA